MKRRRKPSYKKDIEFLESLGYRVFIDEDDVPYIRGKKWKPPLHSAYDESLYIKAWLYDGKNLAVYCSKGLHKHFDSILLLGTWECVGLLSIEDIDKRRSVFSFSKKSKSKGNPNALKKWREENTV